MLRTKPLVRRAVVLGRRLPPTPRSFGGHASSKLPLRRSPTSAGRFQGALLNAQGRVLAAAAGSAKETRQSSSVTAAVGGALLAGGVAAASLWSTDSGSGRPSVGPELFVQSSASTTSCDAAAVNGSESTQFKVMAALEMKDELEKVRLAQLIYDLHAVAKEQAEAKKQGWTGKLKRTITMFSTGNKSAKQPVKTGPNNGLKRRWTEVPTESEIGFPSNYTAENLSAKLSEKEGWDIIEHLRNGKRLSIHSTLKLIEAVRGQLEKEATLIDLRERTDDHEHIVTVIGDLHGSLPSMTSILSMVGESMRNEAKNRTLIFDGDFVDRGPESVEVLCTLMVLKLLYPDRVILLRGNHEDALIAAVYGFQDEIREKYARAGQEENGTEFTDVMWSALGEWFAALPLAARTHSAVIVHGGIPNDQIDLDRDLAPITADQRRKMRSITVSGKGEWKDQPIPGENSIGMSQGQLVQGLVWSDPHADLRGFVQPNPRGCGVMFGPRVARSFLKKNGLKYLIRAHEAVEKGVDVIDCNLGTSVITVFSTAAYPGGKGSNLGGIVHLSRDGGYKIETFKEAKLETSEATSAIEQAEAQCSNSIATIRSMIIGNRRSLTKAFASVEDPETGAVSTQEWVRILGKELDLPNMPWQSLRPSLVPSQALVGHPSNQQSDDEIPIRWRTFLESHSSTMTQKTAAGADEESIEKLHQNQRMLLTVFKFLDADGSGSVDLKEFRLGVEVLNKNLPPERQLSEDPAKLFETLDLDGNGEIDLNEFEQIFSVL